MVSPDLPHDSFGEKTKSHQTAISCEVWEFSDALGDEKKGCCISSVPSYCWLGWVVLPWFIKEPEMIRTARWILKIPSSIDITLEVYGGKFSVIMDDFRRWFLGLWQGKSLAVIIACTTIIICFGFLLLNLLFWY